MESPIILNYFKSSISCFCMLLLYASTLNPVFALENCTFPAIFNFGDSNSDTGGLAAALIAPTPPYGETFFHMPAGRFSDGRLIIDFMAKSIGLPYLSAYLDSLGTNFKHGANFATAASTIRLPAQIIPAGGFSPFYLNIQYSQFEQFKSRSQMIREKGGIYANLMPKRDYFPKALYTFDIGQNDLGEGFFSNMTIEEVNASVPDIVNKFSTNVKLSSLSPENANSFTALLELSTTQAMELLHSQSVDEAPAPLSGDPLHRIDDDRKRFLTSVNGNLTFPSNKALIERAAKLSVFTAGKHPLEHLVHPFLLGVVNPFSRKNFQTVVQSLQFDLEKKLI
ncbi:hypothetical protein FH972_016016 [Carpinus fangiana]|uniref:Alpha-L-fucosidase n=1 Tax=Carpinus fangiana TaxID=176857 RepID=A0A5N6RFR5_9ROSI|nr:hypothetical protein FH972_016016 [Carpinus fangiana]